MSTQASGIEVTTVGHRLDGWILLCTLALVSLGALMVYSASISLDTLAKQAMFTVIGVGFLAAGAAIPYRFWAKYATLIAIGTLVLLIALLIPHVGTASNGAQRWFQFKGIQVQPSEIAKIAFTIFFAVWLTNKGPKIRSLTQCTVPFGLILAFVCLLIVIQPDLGTAVVIGSAMVVMFFVAGARWEHLGLGMTIGFILGFIAINFESYRFARLKVWLDPWGYASNLGFQTTHALEALGAGGLFGAGLGNSHQKYVLPAPATDSIFAVTGEELGFVGTALIVLLFLLLAWRGFNVARKSPDKFGRLLASGITGMIVLQAFLNIAVITNSVPFTGVPLPFISYGGSSLVVSLFSVGILLNISREANRPFRAAQDEPPGGAPRDEDRHNRRKDWRPRIPSFGRGRLIPIPVHIIQIWGRRERLPRYG